MRRQGNVVYLDRRVKTVVAPAPAPRIEPLDCAPRFAVRRARVVAGAVVLFAGLAQQYWTAALFVAVAILARRLMDGKRA